MNRVQASRSSFWKWSVTGLLLIATAINYMDRVALSGASVRISAELGLSDTDYGNLELAFGWSFAVGSITFGFLADRFSLYWLYPFVLVSWSVVGMASGWTHGFNDLLVCRALLGFFEAGHWPCALKTTYVLLNEKERTLGNSILQSGASIGAIITPQIILLLMNDEHGSWRNVFVVVGSIGLWWAVAWLLILRPRDLEQSSIKKTGVDPISLRSIVFSRQFLALAILVLGFQIVWHTYRVWLMKFLQTGRGYSEEFALNFNSIYYLFTDIGCILAGLLSLWLVQHYGLTANRSRRLVYFGACTLTSASVLLPWLDKGALLLLTLLMIGAGALAIAPCYYGFLQDLSSDHVGRLTGLLALWAWAIASPIHSLLGFIADRFHSYDHGLVFAGIAPWAGAIALTLLWKNRATTEPHLEKTS